MTSVLVDSQPSGGVRRFRRSWIAAALTVVVVSAAVPATVWFVHWRASLNLLVGYPDNGVGGPLVVGQSEYFGGEAVSADILKRQVFTGALSIDVSSIRPVVVENSANAEIVVLRCVLAHLGPGPDSYDQADTDSTCSTLTPFRSGNVKLGFAKGDDDLVIQVTPRRAGTVRISGTEVSYSSGLRHGTQHTGLQINFTTNGTTTTH